MSSLIVKSSRQPWAYSLRNALAGGGGGGVLGCKLYWQNRHLPFALKIIPGWCTGMVHKEPTVKHAEFRPKPIGKVNEDYTVVATVKMLLQKGSTLICNVNYLHRRSWSTWSSSWRPTNSWPAGLSLLRWTSTSSQLIPVLISSFVHRWARLLEQQSSITIYRWPTKKNKLPFSISVCSKQTEVAFSVSSFFHLRNSGNMETWRHGHRDMDMASWTWRHGNEHEGIDLKTLAWRHGHGDMDKEIWTWKHGHGDTVETWHGDMDMATWNFKGKNGKLSVCERTD